MALTNGRQPAPVDEEGALDFSDRKPARPSNGATIHLAYRGVPVDLQVTDKRIREIEQLIQGLLDRGWAAPPRGGGFGGRPDTRIDPAFDDAGNEICPIHRAKPKEYKTQDGRAFKGCPSKGTGVQGEQLNQRGYCGLKFK